MHWLLWMHWLQRHLQRELLYGMCGCMFFCLYRYNQRKLWQLMFCRMLW